jgi:hypothetical protein
MDELSSRVEELVGQRVPHLGEWNVSRLDAAFNWRTLQEGRDWVGEYLHAFKSVELPKHHLESIDRTATIYWKNTQRVIRMYDKYRESRSPNATGVLRYEVQLNKPNTEFGYFLGTRNVLARDILNWSVARMVLERYLGRLGANLLTNT